jgi:hypothetical protein
MPFLRQSQEHAQIISNVFEDAGTQPSLGLLIDDLPRWQVMRPRRACSCDPAQAVEHIVECVLTLWCLFVHQCEAGRDERLLFIADVAGVAVRNRPFFPFLLL